MEYCDIPFTMGFEYVDEMFPKPMPENDVEEGQLKDFDPPSLMTIMPCGGTRSLECSSLDSYTETHLLSGVRVYIVWPPTKANMELLEEYLDMSAEDRYWIHNNVCRELQGGITFIQRPGDIVDMPPGCPTVVLSTKTSASVMFKYRRVDGLAWRLRYLGLTVRQ